MNIDTEKVTEVVHVELHVLLLFDQFRRLAFEQTQIHHAFGEHFNRMSL